MIVLFVFLILGQMVLAQPWVRSGGNGAGSSSVSNERPLSKEEASKIRLRWTLFNLSEALEKKIDDAHLFQYMNQPLIPSLGGPRVFVQVLKYVEQCFRPGDNWYSCSRCYLMSINGKSGNVEWVTPHNVSWSVQAVATPDEPGCFAPWWASSTHVFIPSVPDGIGESSGEAWTLTGYSHKGGLPTFSVVLPMDCVDLGNFPTEVLVRPDNTVMYVLVPCGVYAYSMSDGGRKLLWWTELPAKKSDTFFSQATASLSGELLFISYSMYATTDRTIALDTGTGVITWQSPYTHTSPMTSASTWQPLAVGADRIYLSAAISGYSSGILALNTLTGAPAWNFSLNYDHNFVGANFAAGPSEMVTVFGDNSDGPNPTYVFQASDGRLVRHGLINATFLYSDDCGPYYLIGKPRQIIYSYCSFASYSSPSGPYFMAIEISPPSNTQKSPFKILWKVPIADLPPGDNELGMFLGSPGFMYLGHGAFIINANNHGSPIEKDAMLSSIQMYY